MTRTYIQRSKVYGVRDAARMLGRPPRTVREWCESGKLEAGSYPVLGTPRQIWVIPGTELMRIRKVLAADPKAIGGKPGGSPVVKIRTLRRGRGSPCYLTIPCHQHLMGASSL